VSAPKGDKASRELAVAWRAELGDYATALAWSPDGTRCAAASASGELHVFEGSTGKLLYRHEAHPGGVLSLSWHPKARILATGGQDGSARLWHSDHGHLEAEIPAEDEKRRPWALHVSFSPSGKRLAVAAGRKVRLYTESGAPVAATAEHASTVSGMAWNARSTRIATICYGGVHLWSAEDARAERHLAWKGSLISIVWSPNEKVIACGSQDASVHFWRLPGGRDSEMSGYPFKPKALTFNADSTLLATSGEATVTIWKFAGRGPEGTRPILLEAHQGAVTALAFSHHGATLASGAEDAGVVLWAPGRSRGPIGFGFMEDYVSHVAFRPDDALVTGTDASGHVVSWAAR